MSYHNSFANFSVVVFLLSSSIILCNSNSFFSFVLNHLKSLYITKKLLEQSVAGKCLRCGKSSLEYNTMCIECRNELELLWKDIYIKGQREILGKEYDNEKRTISQSI